MRTQNEKETDTTHSSGALNAKHRELLELQALAQRRLKNTRANFADGMKAAKEVKRDLDWTQKRVKYVLNSPPCKPPAYLRILAAKLIAPLTLAPQHPQDENRAQISIAV